MLCITEVTLTPPTGLSHPEARDVLQRYYQVLDVPQPAEISPFIRDLLFETEMWLDRVRAKDPPLPWMQIGLLEQGYICRHRGIVKVVGQNVATFFIEWYLADIPEWQYLNGDWLEAYEEHKGIYCWQQHRNVILYQGIGICRNCETGHVFQDNLCKSCLGYEIVRGVPRPVSHRRQAEVQC